MATKAPLPLPHGTPSEHGSAAGLATAGWAAATAPSAAAHCEQGIRAEPLRRMGRAKGICSPAASCCAALVHVPTQLAATSAVLGSDGCSVALWWLVALLGTRLCQPWHCHRSPVPPEWCWGRSHTVPSLVPSFVAGCCRRPELSATSCSTTTLPVGL